MGRKPTDNEPFLRASPGERGLALRPMLTRGTGGERVGTIKWRNWLILRHHQNGTRVAAPSKTVDAASSHHPPASRRQRAGAPTHLLVESGNSATTVPARGAKMPAGGTEGSGSRVVKCRTVMGRTGPRLPGEAARTDRGRTRRRKQMTVGVLYVLLVRFAVGNDQSARSKYCGPTGKRSAGKLACSVWSGGKVARPYLSLLSGFLQRARGS